MFIRIQTNRIQCLRSSYVVEKKRCEQKIVFSMKADDNIDSYTEKMSSLTPDERGQLLEFYIEHKNSLERSKDYELASTALDVVERLSRGLKNNPPANLDAAKALLKAINYLGKLSVQRVKELTPTDLGSQLEHAVGSSESEE